MAKSKETLDVLSLKLNIFRLQNIVKWSTEGILFVHFFRQKIENDCENQQLP